MKLKMFTAITCMALMSATMIATAGAVPHPEHDQRIRGNGPAAIDQGADRGNPGGSNGTIKIDGVAIDGSFDAHPNNEPHIGCVFEVDLYGLDEGDVALLEFREWHPTAAKDPIYSVSSEGDGDDAGEDGAGGGVDIDDENLIDLRPHVIGNPHPQHGHHVRLDVTVTSTNGDYTKTKVFWTGPCEPATSTPTPTPTPGPGTGTP